MPIYGVKLISKQCCELMEVVFFSEQEEPKNRVNNSDNLIPNEV